MRRAFYHPFHTLPAPAIQDSADLIVRNSLQCYPSSASVGFASQPGFACQTRLHDICDGCTETGPGDNVFSFLTLDEFHSTWTQGGFDLVVDVRSAEAYADGHIPGAFNAPGLAGLGTADLSSYSNLADCSDKKVAVSGPSRAVAPSPKPTAQARLTSSGPHA